MNFNCSIECQFVLGENEMRSSLNFDVSRCLHSLDFTYFPILFVGLYFFFCFFFCFRVTAVLFSVSENTIQSFSTGNDIKCRTVCESSRGHDTEWRHKVTKTLFPTEIIIMSVIEIILPCFLLQMTNPSIMLAVYGLVWFCV